MTDSVALRELIESKGVKISFIARQLDISPAWLKKKIDNEIDFKQGEIVKLVELFGLTTRQMMSIFFVK